MISQEDIQRAKELCEKATPGEWTVDTNQPFSNALTGIFCKEYGGYIVLFEDQEEADVPVRRENADLLAESRTLLPAFIEEVIRLNKVVEQAEVALRVLAGGGRFRSSDYPELAQHLAQGEKK